MTIVTYVNGPASVDPGVKGTYAAPTNNITSAIHLTRAQLIADALYDGVVGDTDPDTLFTIVKVEVAA